MHRDKDTKFETADMVDFYLGMDLDQPGHMTISTDGIGDEVIDIYNLRDYNVTTAKGRIIYFKVVKCLYGRLSFLKLKGDSMNTQWLIASSNTRRATLCSR